MGKSYKKVPVTGHTKKESEKKDKQIANRALRRKNNQLLKDAEEDYYDIKEASNRNTFDKDGKQWCHFNQEQIKRK